MRIRTPICDLFEIEYPLLLAGMGGVSGPDLAAAVSNAGGLGVLGAAGLPPERLEQWIVRTRELTDMPFGVDTLLPASVPQNMQALSRRQGTVEGQPRAAEGERFDPSSLVPQQLIDARDRFMEQEGLTAPQPPAGRPQEGAPRRRGGGFTKDLFEGQLECVLDMHVPLYVSGLGIPEPEFIGRAHSLGMKVMTVAGNTRHARKAADAGVDAVVAQGTDGGGHNSPVGTLALIPQVVDEVAGAIPVIGAGGIVDGRGVAASFMLGALGVWVGTAFLATVEANLPEHQKQAVVAATDRDTVVSKAVTGKPARMLRGKWAELFERERLDPLPMPLQSIVSGPVTAAATAAKRADVWPGFAGQGAGLVKAIRPAADVVADLMGAAAQLLDGVKLRGVSISA